MSAVASPSDLEERKVALAERQLNLDNHWAKVWGPSFITAFLGLVGVVITVMVTSAENNATDQQKSLEGARAAATMYFDELGDLEKKDQLTAAEDDRLLRDLSIITTLSNERPFTTLLVNEEDSVKRKEGITAAGIAAKIADTQPAPKAPTVNSDEERAVKAELSLPSGAFLLNEGGQVAAKAATPAVQSLPDLVPDDASMYTAAAFLAFPQVPAANDPNTKKFADALLSLGFKVQPTQHMALAQSPLDNEIRYYRADQSNFAIQVAAQLQDQTGLTFKPVQLLTPGLPNGVMEFWLGTSSLKPPAAP